MDRLSPADEFTATVLAAVERLHAEEAGDPIAGDVFMARIARISLDAGGFEDDIERAAKRLLDWSLPMTHKLSRTPGKGYMRRKEELAEVVARQKALEAEAARTTRPQMRAAAEARHRRPCVG